MAGAFWLADPPNPDHNAPAEAEPGVAGNIDASRQEARCARALGSPLHLHGRVRLAASCSAHRSTPPVAFACAHLLRSRARLTAPPRRSRSPAPTRCARALGSPLHVAADEGLHARPPLVVGTLHLEDAVLSAATPSERRLHGLVRLRELLGSEVVVHFEVEAAPVVTEETRDLAEDVDASALTELDHLRSARRTSFVGRFAAEAPTQEGTVAEIAVSPGALRFFDPDSGARIGS